jgi:alpha-galactosidase
MIHPRKPEGIMKKCRTALFGILCLVIFLSHATRFGVDTSNRVKVFILAGQSNMEGKAKVELLEYQINQSETRDFFKHLKEDGRRVKRNDVWINFLDRKGKLTVGFGSPKRIGPELEFGNTVGDHFKEQVLTIETAWGGKSLGRDFRPPSSGLPSEGKLKEIVRKTNERNKVGSDYGYHYLGGAITFSKIGKAFGEAMLEFIETHN